VIQGIERERQPSSGSILRVCVRVVCQAIASYEVVGEVIHDDVYAPSRAAGRARRWGEASLHVFPGRLRLGLRQGEAEPAALERLTRHGVPPP
jgi:hypothetical protein